MAGVTALRDAARMALLEAGGRGFVRFLAEGDTLLVSDAPRRCGDQGCKELALALEKAGFSCRIEDGLAYLTPGRARLCALCDAQPEAVIVDWEHPLYQVQALCARLLREAREELDDDGCLLVMETARLLWQPEKNVLSGITALRARIAVRLRKGKRSGLYEAGRLLCGWLREIDA